MTPFDAGAQVMRERICEMLLAGIPNTYERNTLELRIRAMRIEHLDGRLRPYQQEAVAALASWDYSIGNPLLVVPTGGGKSLIQAAHIANNPSARVLCVTHVRELVAQNHAAFLRLCPDADAGIYSAGIGRRDTKSRVLFAGVQSVYRRPEVFGHFDVVIVDEVHRCPKKGAGMYRQLFAALKATNPDVRIIGMTATPFRTDSGSLSEGDDRLFHGTAYECDLVSLIEQGYLSDVHCRGTAASIDTKGVKVRAREFVAEELEQRAMAEGLVVRAVDEIIERAGSRRSWLIFCAGIAHAEAVAMALWARAITAVTVFGHTPNAERDAKIQAFKNGEMQAMVNVGVLTTGFDAPATDLIVLLRPTMSPVLYVQMVGRGLRTAPGKDQGCLLLDFGGNVMRHGPINDVRLSKKSGDSDKGAPLRECPECHEFSHIAATSCWACGHTFPRSEAEPHDEVAADGITIIKRHGEPTGVEKWRVKGGSYSYHAPKIGKKPTLRVQYRCEGGRTANQFMCFEHDLDSYGWLKAERWWRKMTGNPNAEVPRRVGEAARLIAAGAFVLRPVEITVDTRGAWPEVKRVKREPIVRPQDHPRVEESVTTV